MSVACNPAAESAIKRQKDDMCYILEMEEAIAC